MSGHGDLVRLKCRTKGHVSLLLWRILLILAWLNSDRLKLCLWGAASSGHSHGAQAAQGPFLARAAQVVLDLWLHLLSPAREHLSLASPSSSGTTFPSPSSQAASTAPGSVQQSWGSPSWGLNLHSSLTDQHVVIPEPGHDPPGLKAPTLSSLQGVGTGGVPPQSHLSTDL